MDIFFLDQLRNQPYWVLFFAFLGFLSLTNFSFSFLRWVYAFFLRPGKDLRRVYGSWAVLTGATSGIGKSLAFELARKGLNLVLLGRNPDKLREVSNAISGEVPTAEIKSIIVDLGGDIKEGALRLHEAIEGLDVGLLVNNAGLGEPGALFFHEVDIELWMKIVKVNVEALTEITRQVLPVMLKRKRGAILNIGSGSTVVIPSYPLFAVYAATKEYINQFSRCLYFECKNRGIDVQCQAPLYVATSMTSYVLRLRRHSFFVALPNAYAEAAVRWIGYEPLSIPYWPHFLQWCFASLFPDFFHYKIRLSTSLQQRELVLKRIDPRMLRRY